MKVYAVTSYYPEDPNLNDPEDMVLSGTVWISPESAKATVESDSLAEWTDATEDGDPWPGMKWQEGKGSMPGDTPYWWAEDPTDGAFVYVREMEVQGECTYPNTEEHSPWCKWRHKKTTRKKKENG